MSSILKALKRLERDKARRDEDNLDLARDILRGDGRRSGSPRWLLSLLVVLVVLLVLAVAVLLRPRRDVSTPADVSSAPSATVAAAPAVEPLIVEEIIDRRQPAPIGVRTARNAAPPQVAALPVAVTTVPDPQPAKVPAPLLVPPQVEPVAATPSADTALAVSAIIYNDDPSSRLAVINDLPVMEGTMIGSVRVEEILSDRVIFSRAGVRFAIPYEGAAR
jgi:general secretion pathway protein B